MRFDGAASINEGSQTSSISPGNQYHRAEVSTNRQQMQIMEQEDERDSEDPDEPEDSQIMEDRYKEFDPQLDQRIEAIKRQVGSSS